MIQCTEDVDVKIYPLYTVLYGVQQLAPGQTTWAGAKFAPSGAQVLLLCSNAEGQHEGIFLSL